jgi:hypothetical protein
MWAIFVIKNNMDRKQLVQLPKTCQPHKLVDPNICRPAAGTSWFWQQVDK